MDKSKGFPLLKCNPLIRRDSNIWTTSSKGNFDYSDGDTAEEYLKDAIANAQDLTSQSLELEEKIVDWVSEYHLSSQRANLLRALNLDGVKNTLELGSGCGAITRYLGELGINVDAVEGNLRRAEIARLRCRDLENVTVINANFNDLTFPKGAYDAVFLIGVLEYAKKFLPTSVDDKDAVINILSCAKSALKKEGLLFIATENRMGLKYWMGASEDHYGQPHVGLYGFPQDQGIRTYDKREWEDILERADVKCYRFCYPFPDYKLARVVLSDTYIQKDGYACSTLHRICSRDYVKEWQPVVDEFLLWESLHQSGYLEHFANSFFIIISDSMEQLNEIISNDFVYFSDPDRKPIYRTVTLKPRDKDYIVKKKMSAIEVEEGDEFIRQNLARETYIKGPLLSSAWIHSIVGSNDTTYFERLIGEYYRFLLGYFNKERELTDAFDLLPFNIIVDDTGSYRVMDKEWKITTRINPEYVLFRALLYFAIFNRISLSTICELRDITIIKEFVAYGFSLLSLQLDQELDKFIELEERVQEEVVFKKRKDPVKNMLKEPFRHVVIELQSKTFLAQLFWAGENEVFCEENSITVSAQMGTERQVLIFKLPHKAHNALRLRLDPANRPGFFHLFNMMLKLADFKDMQEEILWQLRGAQEIAGNSQMENVHFCKASLGEVFLSTNDDPQIVFELPETITAGAREGTLQLEVELDWPKSADYLIAKDALGKKIALQKQQIHAKDGVIQEQAQQIQEHLQQIHAKDGVIQEQAQQIQEYLQQIHAKDGLIQEQAQQIEAKENFIHHIESELKVIKGSKTWRLAEAFRRLFYIKLLGRFPMLQKAMLTISREGFSPFFMKAKDYIKRNKRVVSLGVIESDYDKWIKKNRLTEDNMGIIKKEIEEFQYKPKISIIMPVYDVDQIWLEKAINSVLDQLYENWELCIADDASTKKYIKKTLERYLKKDKRIIVKYLEENQGISGASNEALSLASGDFIGLLDNDDELSVDALYECVRLLDIHPEADMIYSDEDKLNIKGRRCEPHFKPDWSPDMFLSGMYTCHFSLYRKRIVDEIGGFRKGYEGSQDYDLALRFTEKSGNIFHIPKILYHWRKIPGSAADSTAVKDYAYVSAKRALSSYLMRNSIKGEIVDGEFIGSYRVRREVKNDPKISVIITFKDRVEALEGCIKSITEKTNYQNFEIILVNNQTEKEEALEYLGKIKDDRVLTVLNCDKPFNFSAVSNYAVSQLDSQYIVFLNNNIEVISPDWIEAMLEFAQRKDVGAVGALLYYPNDTVQHGGIILGINGIAGYSHKGLRKDSLGYFGRLKTIQNLSAVSAACLMTKKTVFEEVDCFDENYSYTHSDVDLCLKMREKGYLIVYTPYAELYYHESLSMCYGDTQEDQGKLGKDKEYFEVKWKDLLSKGDPYYNPNLTLEREDFSIRL